MRVNLDLVKQQDTDYSQMNFKYKGTTKTYCTDIEDGDKNAPLSKTSFVSRKTATRFMASASIRETIEKFLKDLNDWK